MSHQFQNILQERILLSFLNWGKGHLSRCIDVCRRLIQQNNEVIVACTPEDAEVLKSYLPQLTCVPFEGYPFQFAGTGNFANDLWSNRTALMAFMFHEQEKVEKLVEEHQISLIVSDHRYGFRSEKVTSIIIAHQIQLALKWWQFPAQWIHKSYLKQFQHVWIMDDEKSSLAGKLSKNTFKNASFIGHFSRFEEKETIKDLNLGVVNGPAPYDEQLLKKLLEDPNIKTIISSIPSHDVRVIHPKNWQEVDELFYRAKNIYGYCGYSTIMDIKKLKTKGILFPTPGQSEQEYLIRFHRAIDFSEATPKKQR